MPFAARLATTSLAKKMNHLSKFENNYISIFYTITNRYSGIQIMGEKVKILKVLVFISQAYVVYERHCSTRRLIRNNDEWSKHTL
jgi:hypothetical protein